MNFYLRRAITRIRAAFQLLVALAVLSVVAHASRTLVDEAGRTVTVPDQPHRLIALAPSITDTLYAMGLGDEIVGITDYTKYPAEAAKKPSVGGVINPSLEAMVAMKPDLVLAIGELNNYALIHSIEHLGLTVFVIRPQGIAGIYRSIESIGKAVHREELAEALVARLRAREQAVRERVAGKPRPTVFFLLWLDPLMTAGHNAFVTELIAAAGGRSITDDLLNEWPRVSFETVLARQPDYILLVSASHITLAQLQGQSSWQKLDAVRKGKVLYEDDRLQYPSPVAFDALESLARQLHP